MTSNNGREPRIETGPVVDPGAAPMNGAAQAAIMALARIPSGREAVSHCVGALAENLPVGIVLLALFDDPAHNRLRSRLLLRDGEPLPEIDYPVDGAPCRDALNHGQCLVGEAVAVAYPNCAWLTDLALQGYIGTRIQAADGRQLGILAIGTGQPLDDPESLRAALAVCADRIAVEIAAASSARDRELAASVFQHCPQGIMITDAGHRIRKVNKAFLAITGWQETDVIGRSDSILSAGRDDGELAGEIRLALDAVGIWVGEMWSRRRDGEVFPETRTIVAVRDPQRGLSYVINLINDISGEKFATERIYRLAHYDATTDLPNRVLLQDRLLHAINRAARAGNRLALLFLDLDGFKAINDSMGHAAGDEVLRQVGLRLKSRLRKVDVVARIGGDEFAVLLSDVAQDSDIQAICDQLLEAVTEPYELNDVSRQVTASIGIAVYPEDGLDVQSLLKQADLAMYQAKARGKNRYVFFAPEMNRRAEERQHLAHALRGALDQGDISLCYQPQYDLANGRLVGVEALLRWRDANGQMVPPKRFVRIAEDNGMIVELGARALREACRQAQQWQEQGLDFGRLAVNVSGRQFQDEDLPARVSDALAASGLAPQRLELEISESWVMEGPFRAEKQMRVLAGMGVGLVIDNFGLANLSMAYLKRFPVQKLKIDGSFTRDISTDGDDAAIVSAIIAMGHSLGLRVLAEGVETAEQRAFLRATGCDEAQGYLFGHPVQSDELNVLLLYSPTLSS